MLRVLADCPLLVRMCHHSNYNHVTVRNQSDVPYYHLAQEQEGLGYEELVLWQKETQSIGHGSCSCDLFLLDLSYRNSCL